MPTPTLKSKTPKAAVIGRNVNVVSDKSKITITIDLTAEAEPSGSGKTMIVASSQGNKRIDDTWFIGLNVYRYPERKK